MVKIHLKNLKQKKHVYKYKNEHKHRYRDNNRYINTRNRAGLSYTMKLNKFADRTVSLENATN
jgi:hypothetical protein